MNTCILFRKSLADDGEYEIAQKYFDVYTQRSDIPRHSTVIGRYSTLPFYKELVYDLDKNLAYLLNSYKQHKWIADFEYYNVLKEYTPETWDDETIRYCKYDGPFVVKGKTNSRKYRWNTHMFAKTKIDALKIGCELMNDELIATQGVLYRKYYPLLTYEVGLNGLPFANEWRFFFYKNHLLSYGYYWSISEYIPNQISPKAIEFAQKIAKIASQYTNFFVLDVAETVEGKWILIEINDGSMSGLSENNPHTLYSNLKSILN
jgi:hypothetical protein